MAVLGFLARTLVVALFAGRAAVRAGRAAGRGVLRVRRRGGGGETGMIRLLDLHAASCAGDTLIAIGLAGTIFFTVPTNEARGRVALYLIVTMLPFALLAPVVGPLLDRFRHGRRYALAVTMLGRAFLAYLISEHLTGLALYPAAFGVLVLSRAYGVARSAAVPRLIPPGLGLSQAGAQASLFGTLAGALAVPFGLLAYQAGPQWVLRLAMVPFVFGMVVALRLPPRTDSQPPETVPRPLLWPGHRGGPKILTGHVVIATLVGSATLRALYGFLTLYLAFAVRSDDLPAALLGAELRPTTALALVAGTLGVGSFLATAIGTRLRIHRPALLQAVAIGLVCVVALVAAARYTLGAALLLCLACAIGSGLAKLAVDATIQERIAEPVRASAFAHSETLLMLAWVAGGALGLIPFPGRPGMVVAAVFALAAMVRAIVAAVQLRAEKLRGAPADESVAAGEPASPAQPWDRTQALPPWDRTTQTLPRPDTPASPPGAPGSVAAATTAADRRSAPGGAADDPRPAAPIGAGDRPEPAAAPRGKRWLRRLAPRPAGNGVHPATGPTAAGLGSVKPSRDGNTRVAPAAGGPTTGNGPPPGQRVSSEPAPTRVLPESADDTAPPGFHLYRPSRIDPTARLEEIDE